VYTYSTSAGVGAAPFVPSTIAGDITTIFSISGNGVLQWINSAFFNGQASFCVVQNGTVYAVFAQGAQPDGCLFIQLTLFSVSSCQGISFATITGPPGPQVCHRALRGLIATADLLSTSGQHRSIGTSRKSRKPRDSRYSGQRGSFGASGKSRQPGYSGYTGCSRQHGVRHASIIQMSNTTNVYYRPTGSTGPSG